MYERKEYIYSKLSSPSVRHLVTSNYDLTGPVSCKFYVLGLHDNYLIETGRQRFICRIYRNDWRSQEEIRFEMELLAFLSGKTALVSYPIPTTSGQLTVGINAPEGIRTAVLFRYADGHAPGNDISVEESMLLGQAVATMHSITESFKTACIRPILDIPYLLDESIVAIDPFVDTETLCYLKTLQAKIHSGLPTIEKTAGAYGICTGDINPTNFHINEHKQITLFDFDQCGFGYRAFEIGKFIASIHSMKMKHSIAEAFINGYQHIRQLHQNEVLSIPYFEIVSTLWVMAIHAYNAERIGHKYLEKPYWDRKISILKDLENF